MNTNEVQTEPLEVQPGSYSADALAASVAEKFAELFRQAHPPLTPSRSERFAGWRLNEAAATPKGAAGVPVQNRAGE